jgi:hypothetical protein
MTSCYDVPCPFWTRCLWCVIRGLCRNEFGELAARNSDYCRYVQYHIVKKLKNCDLDINEGHDR